MEPTGSAYTRVLIVDDHEVLAESLAHIIDHEPDLTAVGVASTLQGARELVRSRSPHVMLLDHGLPDGDGVAAIPEFRALCDGLQVVVLTANTLESVLLASIEAGAAGFVSKSRGIKDVTAAVRAAAAGDSVISPELLARLLPRLTRARQRTEHQLTEREREVLGLLAQGLTNAAIADRLTLSVNTVRNHISNLSAKLGAHSKLEALSIGIREGLLPPS